MPLSLGVRSCAVWRQPHQRGAQLSSQQRGAPTLNALLLKQQSSELQAGQPVQKPDEQPPLRRLHVRLRDDQPQLGLDVLVQDEQLLLQHGVLFGHGPLLQQQVSILLGVWHAQRGISLASR